MALTLQTIITEADVLVPNNGITTADKIVKLNAINGDFFNVVKISKVYRFSSTTAGTIALPDDVRQKNIDLLQIGSLRYRSLDDGSSPGPLECFFSFDDVSHTLTLSPAPYKAGLDCLCRHRRIGKSSFVPGNLNVSPDAPEEYHWTYIPALAAWLARTEDDMVKAGIYDQQYKDAWNVAAQGFVGGAGK